MHLMHPIKLVDLVVCEFGQFYLQDVYYMNNLITMKVDLSAPTPISS